jgi:hypothetical protein
MGHRQYRLAYAISVSLSRVKSIQFRSLSMIAYTTMAAPFVITVWKVSYNAFCIESGHESRDVRVVLFMLQQSLKIPRETMTLVFTFALLFRSAVLP